MTSCGECALITSEEMSKAFSNQLVLKEVNLQVEHGDIYALVGGNGAEIDINENINGVIFV